jgi:hypothetical protein
LGRTDLAERGGIDEVEVAANDFGKAVFGAVAAVAREQLQVGVAHCQKYIAAGQGNPTRFDELLAVGAMGCSRLYFPAPVAQFESDMKQSGRYLWLWGWLAFMAIRPGIHAETNALPHFQEVFRILRANLPNATEEELNQAAVQGLLEHFKPRVILVANEPARGAGAKTPLVSRVEIYDKFCGYMRVERVASGLAEEIVSVWERLNATNKLKGLILDLRFAGGEDYAAVGEVADGFLTKEHTLLTWDGGSARSKKKADALTMPLTVLMNERTSGAGEALAAVLRDTGAALLIGNATAGEAHVYKEFELSNGQRLRVAASPVRVGEEEEVLTKGIVPDIPIAVSAEDEKAYFADAFRVLSKPTAQLRGTNNLSLAASTNRQSRRRINEAELVRMQRDGENLDELGPPSPSRPSDDAVGPVVRDPALVRALDLLKGIAIVQQAR